MTPGLLDPRHPEPGPKLGPQSHLPCSASALSLLVALGVPPHVVREIAGHSDIKVTMMVYAHGRLDEKATALTQLGTAVAERCRQRLRHRDGQ
jgi:hypothetical protein